MIEQVRWLMGGGGGGANHSSEKISDEKNESKLKEAMQGHTLVNLNLASEHLPEV